MARTPHKNEFQRIATYLAPLTAAAPGAFGLLDDAAVIETPAGQSTVVTTDTMVEGVHYVGDEAPSLIARKLLRVNLSDLAAMGARPSAYTLNLALPESVSDAWLADFTEGLRLDQTSYGISLIGGDSVATPGPATLTITAFGDAAEGEVLRRAGARAGDGLYVSGTIGDGALGLLVLRGEIGGLDAIARDELVDRYRLPRPRSALGVGLVGTAHAAADISDGLVADLGHVASASGLAAEIDLACIPLSSAAGAALDHDSDLWPTVLAGGDDYELVFAAPETATLDELSAHSETPITRIGEFRTGTGVTVMGDGVPMVLDRAGYRHG